MIRTTKQFKKTAFILSIAFIIIIILSSFLAFYYGKTQSAKRFLGWIEKEYSIELPKKYGVELYHTETYIDGQLAIVTCDVTENYKLDYDVQFLSTYREGEPTFEEIVSRDSFKLVKYLKDSPYTQWFGREDTKTRYRDCYIIYQEDMHSLIILFEIHQYA